MLSFISDAIKYQVFRHYPIFRHVGRVIHFTIIISLTVVIMQSVKALTHLPHIQKVNDPLVFLSVLLTFMTSFLMGGHGNVSIFFLSFLAFFFFSFLSLMDVYVMI
jgi:hypothetical protein